MPCPSSSRISYDRFSNTRVCFLTHCFPTWATVSTRRRGAKMHLFSPGSTPVGWQGPGQGQWVISETVSGCGRTCQPGNWKTAALDQPQHENRIFGLKPKVGSGTWAPRVRKHSGRGSGRAEKTGLSFLISPLLLAEHSRAAASLRACRSGAQLAVWEGVSEPAFVCSARRRGSHATATVLGVHSEHSSYPAGPAAAPGRSHHTHGPH